MANGKKPEIRVGRLDGFAADRTTELQDRRLGRCDSANNILQQPLDALP
jgi:hypothetical protein